MYIGDPLSLDHAKEDEGKKRPQEAAGEEVSEKRQNQASEKETISGP
jgi:hypothetical protein